MSALAMWLTRWQPIAIHGAMLAGAKPEAGALAPDSTAALMRCTGVSTSGPCGNVTSSSAASQESHRMSTR
jgi:hypothetical protein